MKKHAYLLVGILPLFASAARAEDLRPVVERRVRAMQTGFETKSLPVLKRLAGPGRAAVKQRLVASLEQSLAGSEVRASDAVSEDKNEVMSTRSAAGRRWFLQVRGDGSAASFVDEDAMRRGHVSARSHDARQGAAELEQRGRAFIAQTLREQITLGPGESLEALSTGHLVEDSVRIEGERYSQEGEARVLASRIVFGRKVDGTAVLGPGSWVSVTFTNDGTPVEFEYDWPAYSRVQATRATLGLDAILERADVLAEVPLDAPGVQLRHMECGYYDSTSPGASLQPACSLAYSHQATDGTVTVRAAVIPAGKEVEPDARWRETGALGNLQSGMGGSGSPRVAALRAALRGVAARSLGIRAR